MLPNKMYSLNNYINQLRNLFIIAFLCIASLTQVACRIYRFDVRQGNELEQKKLDQLRPNQTKEEVQKILGTVALDPIEPNRLDYYYSLNPNGDGITKRQHIILFFDNRGKLNHYVSENADLVIRTLPKKATPYKNMDKDKK